MKIKVVSAIALACFSTAAQAQAQAAAPSSAPSDTAPKKPPGPAAKPGASQEVTVTAAPQDYRSTIDRKSYSLAKDLQATTGGIGDALRNIPSVDVDVQGNLSLRGSSNVTILVDGQPSPLFSGPSRADALQQLPANQFERVEVITNPSAAFKPDGSGGIINLVTKKGQSGVGVIGSIRAQASFNDRYSVSTNLSYGNKVYSITGGIALAKVHNQVDNRTDGFQVDPVSGQSVSTDARTTSTNDPTVVSLYSAGSYNLTKQDRFTGNASLFSVRTVSEGSGFYRTDPLTGPLAQDYTQSSRVPVQILGSGLAAGYVHKFPGDQNEFSINLNYRTTANRIDVRSTLDYLTPAAPPLFQEIGQYSSTDQTDLKAEYKRPLSASAKMVLGYELDDQHQSIDHPVSIGTSAANAAPSVALTNLFKFDQTLHAVYATYQQTFGPLTVLPGLRLEDALIDTNLVTTHTTGSQDYVTAYPTLHVNYDLKGGGQLKASYSRRVDRPTGAILNPFRLYNGPLAYSQGNPNLKPQTTDSYELGYEIRDKTGTYYSATLYYRDNRKSFTTVTEDLGAGVLLTTNENLGKSRNTGLEFVANGKLLKTLSYNASGNLYYNQIDASNLGYATGRSAFTQSGRVNLNWEPTPKDFFQVNMSATAKQLTPQGYKAGYSLVNLGLRHKLDDRWSFISTVQDLFNSTRIRTVIDTATLRQDSRIDVHARTLFLGFTYALGSTKVKRPDTFDYSSGPGAGAAVTP